MVARAIDLLKDPKFVLKIIGLILVLVGFVFVILQDPFIWPNSVTMILCIDTGTCVIILTVILLAYVLEEPHQLIELCFTVVGIVAFVVGSILAFRNYSKAQDRDVKKDFHLGIIFCVTTGVMIIDTFLNAKQIIDGFDREI